LIGVTGLLFDDEEEEEAEADAKLFEEFLKAEEFVKLELLEFMEGVNPFKEMIGGVIFSFLGVFANCC